MAHRTYVSFDTTVMLPNVGTVADEDIAILQLPFFSAVLTGSSIGIPRTSDYSGVVTSAVMQT